MPPIIRRIVSLASPKRIISLTPPRMPSARLLKSAPLSRPPSSRITGRVKVFRALATASTFVPFESS